MTRRQRPSEPRYWSVSARISRSISRCPVSTALQKSPASVAPALPAAHDRARPAAAVVRVRAVGAVEERPAAVRHRHRQRCGHPQNHRGDHPGHAVDQRRSGVFDVRRQWREELPALAKLRQKPFPNDHLDQFFNAAVDAAIVMTTFMNAAAAIGLGCCPMSAVRDIRKSSARRSACPSAPSRWPGSASAGRRKRRHTPRLSLRTTVIENHYGGSDLAADLDAYDRRRAKLRPYRRQRDADRWGEVGFYGWSEDKARQYAEPTRTDFGRFVRSKGFCFD